MYVQADAGGGLRRLQGDSISEEQEKKKGRREVYLDIFFTNERNRFHTIELFWAEPIIKVTLYDGFSVVLRMMSNVFRCSIVVSRCSIDVFRCSEMFSDVLRMISIAHRYSMDILRCVQDMFI